MKSLKFDNSSRQTGSCSGWRLIIPAAAAVCIVQLIRAHPDVA
jgi:hypothetical protein